MAELPDHEGRVSPRYEVYAAVTVPTDGGLLIFEVKNISLGGLFVLIDEDARAAFPIGTAHDLTLIAAHEDGEASVAIKVLPMRHEKTGTAFMIVQRGEGLAELIDRMKKV